MERAREYPACPSCRTNVVRRSRRQGFLEQTISLLYVYPFRCRLCSYRFLALQWGARFERYTPDLKAHAGIPARVRAVRGGPLPLVTTHARHAQAVMELCNELFPHEEHDGWFLTPHAALNGDCPSGAMQNGNAEAVYRLLVRMVHWH